jgi:hypothetical protein
MAEAAKPPRRERLRRDKHSFERKEIARRVCDFYTDDNNDRAEAIYMHLQRQAKYRMWTEGQDGPWEGSSDCAIPDMMTHSQKVQDTLHNAVMSSRPAVIGKAANKANKPKETRINELLDYQMFVENPGETLVSDLCVNFVNDPVVTVFTPWVREHREGHEIHTLPPIPDDTSAEDHFATYLEGVYRAKFFEKKDDDGWSWKVSDDGEKWFAVDFYTVNDSIEMDARKDQEVFNGPCPRVCSFEDVLAPGRAANLHIPSPSNPGGSAHVIMVDYPTLDEVQRLAKGKFYDLITAEELESLEHVSSDDITGMHTKDQLDALQGTNTTGSERNDRITPGHRTLTRYTCFDIYDIDGDGTAEDVIWWVIKENEVLLRARELTQVYPANPPRRPFSETSFLPVPGRRLGISLLEMMEGLHDLIKQFADQTIDNGTMSNIPFGFYRATGNMRPETIRLGPGDLYPLANPKDDIVFPQMPQSGSAFGMNLMTMFTQMEERLTNIGDLQLGRVPQGKSSALRTVRGMQSVMGQGEARPERTLRRFFMCLSDVYAQMHALNQTFLPRNKQFRVHGVAKPGEDPFRSIDDPREIQGRFQFDFLANALNTSKEAIQEALEKLMATYVNPLLIQLGIVGPENVYQMARDYGKALGQDPDKYLTPPSPESMLPKLFAEEALSLIIAGQMPDGLPAEPSAQEHMQKLMDFANTDQIGFLTPLQVEVFKAYLTKLRQRMQEEMQRQAMMAAASQFQGGPGGGQPGTPGPQGTAPIDNAPPPVQRNELLDETLPGAGGGANTGVMQ